MRRFPPSCVVRVKVDRFAPNAREAAESIDRFMIVASVFEGGQLGLRRPDEVGVRWRVEPEDVEEVVAFCRGMTREWVEEVLSGD